MCRIDRVKKTPFVYLVTCLMQEKSSIKNFDRDIPVGHNIHGSNMKRQVKCSLNLMTYVFLEVLKERLFCVCQSPKQVIFPDS